jgi:hypothetical protein
VWHASIALFGPDERQVLPTAGLDRKRRRLALALGERLLDGVGDGRVGDGKTLEQVKPIAFHVRRALSAVEMAAIDQEWCAIPAVDAGDPPGSDPGRFV